jgi:hypothetical protein
MAMTDSLETLPLFAHLGASPETEHQAIHETSQAPRGESFFQQVRQFNDFGQTSAEYEEAGIPYLVSLLHNSSSE